MRQHRRVLVVSRFRLSGEALRSYLSKAEPDYGVDFATCLDAGSVAMDPPPDVVVIDCSDCDPACPGIVAVGGRHSSRIIVIARSPDWALQVEWLKTGVLGVIDEARWEPGTLRRAIRCVLAGEVWASPKLLSDAFAAVNGQYSKNGGTSELTGREREILNLLRTGLSNATISSRLGISEKTVKGHLTNVYRKLGVRSRTQAIAHLERQRSNRSGR